MASSKSDTQVPEETQANIVSPGVSEPIKGESGPPVEGVDFSPSEGEEGEPESEEVPQAPSGNPMPIKGSGSAKGDQLSLEIKLSVNLRQ